tara:strand:- start:1099 stop:1305 length:207 start_codon:yes stop_codon:yes gene_type:complete
MKRIAHRVDKWSYVGGHVGHLWKDLHGNQHNNISDIMERYCIRNNQAKFIVDWKKGELFSDENRITNN